MYGGCIQHKVDDNYSFFELSKHIVINVGYETSGLPRSVYRNRTDTFTAIGCGLILNRKVMEV